MAKEQLAETFLESILNSGHSICFRMEGKTVDFTGIRTTNRDSNKVRKYIWSGPSHALDDEKEISLKDATAEIMRLGMVHK